MTLLLFVILVVLIAVAALTIQQLLRSQRVSGPDPEWLASFDLARYAPMRRLLDRRETQYLKETGVPAVFVSQLRAERRRIFRIYLRNLTRDVARLHAAARTIILTADDGAPELASRLATARIRFFLAIANVRFCLALHALGAEGIGVDVSGLIGSAAQVVAGMRASQPIQQHIAL